MSASEVGRKGVRLKFSLILGIPLIGTESARLSGEGRSPPGRRGRRWSGGGWGREGESAGEAPEFPPKAGWHPSHKRIGKSKRNWSFAILSLLSTFPSKPTSVRPRANKQQLEVVFQRLDDIFVPHISRHPLSRDFSSAHHS